MKAFVSAVLAIFICIHSAASADDDGGFHSIAEYLAVDPTQVVHLQQQNIDDVFDTRGIVQRLATVKKVRLFRKPTGTDDPDLILAYWDMERKGPLIARLSKQWKTVEIEEKAFRPVLDLASDFNNYGDVTMCGFEPGVALLIGDEEPEFILICCFKCHDIHVVRRPTADHPMPYIAEVGMSPELETAIFTLARAALANDQELQSFKLAKRERSKTPIVKAEERSPGTPSDPFSVIESKTSKGTD